MFVKRQGAGIAEPQLGNSADVDACGPRTPQRHEAAASCHCNSQEISDLQRPSDLFGHHEGGAIAPVSITQKMIGFFIANHLLGFRVKAQ